MRSARDRALAAASAILAREGYAGLTMERVAADSGVAKTTVYRSWKSKAALCVELYLNVAARELHDPDTGRVAADLEEITNTVVHLQTRTIAGAALTGVLAEAQLKGDGTARLVADFAEKRRAVTRAVLRRAIDRGEIRADTDIDLVIDAIGGATTFRLLQGHAPLTRKFAADLVRLVLSGCRK
jgi:AcrR family transcriptional regulator